MEVKEKRLKIQDESKKYMPGSFAMTEYKKLETAGTGQPGEIDEGN